MNVRVVSTDQQLYNLCHDIRQTSPACEWQLLWAAALDSASPESELYIWDFDQKVGLPLTLRENPARHLFLVDRNDLEAFQTCIGRADVAVLLKPVTRTTMAAFLGLAVSAYAERISTATGIRAERDEILQCLIQANLKLQESDHNRTNFLARALHDFRSPLTALNGYCDLLLNGALGPLRDEQKDVIGRMTRSAQRLSQMSSAMYELSIGRQVHPVNRREADIEDCIDQALHEAQSIASMKDIGIATKIDPASAPLFFDPDAIEQVLVHLLENACKFTARGGTIEISGYPFFWDRRRMTSSAPLTTDRRREHSSQLNAFRVDILHSGLRIPDGHLHTMFEESASYSGGQDRSGGGLGLAVCRLTIARHDGLIWADNRAGGPVFSFVLPLRPNKSAPCSTGATSEKNYEHETGR
jgi:signal transduction histidine kinase